VSSHSCPRCGGQLFQEHVFLLKTPDVVCLQCGYREYPGLDIKTFCTGQNRVSQPYKYVNQHSSRNVGLTPRRGKVYV
jgi:uncharacterized Zn finger protein (UPF0148 family)